MFLYWTYLQLTWCLSFPPIITLCILVWKFCMLVLIKGNIINFCYIKFQSFVYVKILGFLFACKCGFACNWDMFIWMWYIVIWGFLNFLFTLGYWDHLPFLNEDLLLAKKCDAKCLVLHVLINVVVLGLCLNILLTPGPIVYVYI